MLRKVRIGKRLTLAFGTMVLLTLIVGLLALQRFDVARDHIEQIAERRLPSAILVGEMNQQLLMARLYTVNILLAENDDDRLQHRQTLSAALDSYQQLSARAAAFHQSEAGRQVFAEVIRAKQSYDQLHHQMVALIDEKNLSAASEFRHQGLNQAAANVSKALQQLALYQQDTGHARANEAVQDINTALEAMLVVVVLAVIIGATLTLVFTHSLTGPLQQAVRATQSIAEGNLLQSLHDEWPDEAGDMMRAMAQMQHQLKQTLGEIHNSSEQLATTSQQLSAVTVESVEQIQQQHAELGLAATAVTELSSAIEAVAQSAAATSHDSGLADEQARQGQQQVALAIDSIGALELELQQACDSVAQLVTHVHQISTVVDVIRTLADQTNLLALNAAIEAARAGEGGRGFAVVAEEVRALAKRTQHSTAQIEQMVLSVQSETGQTVRNMQESSARASNSLLLARQAGNTFAQISAAVAQISAQNLTIASAAEEQAVVAREVDNNILNIKDLSVMTSTGATQTKAAAGQLTALAQQLRYLVSRFKV